MSAKRQKRIKETAEELEKTVGTKQLVEVEDEALFELDRVGSKSAKRKLAQKSDSLEKHGSFSKTEVALIKKAATAPKKVPFSQITREKENIRDLWDEEVTVPKRKDVKPVSKSRLPLPGQSYNPSVEDHRKVLNEALAHEQKKIAEAERIDSLVLINPNNSIDKFELSDDGSDDSEGEEDEEGDGTTGKSYGKLSRKQRTKMTRAQRNKIKARNMAEYEKSKETVETSVLKAIEGLPGLLKGMAKEERQLAARHQQEKKLKAAREAEEARPKLGSNEVGQVALSDELSGSLRSLIPKSVGVVDQTNHMTESGDLMRRDRRKRRAYEKPHGAKNVVWIPKYKVNQAK